MKKRILISGASIAGPMTAYWLGVNGFDDVTVIERSDGLRLGGQNIDFSDAARDVIDKMKLTEPIKQKHTGEKGLMFVDTNNQAKAKFPVDKKRSLTKEIEILRGDLVNILVKANPKNINYQFGLSIKSLQDTENGVIVTFDNGSKDSYDIVIAADGMNSSTRKLIIGDGDYEKYLGCWSSYFTVPRTENDNDWWRWYTCPTGVIAFLRPDNDGTMRASVNFLSKENDPPHMTLDDKKRIL